MLGAACLVQWRRNIYSEDKVVGHIEDVVDVTGDVYGVVSE